MGCLFRWRFKMEALRGILLKSLSYHDPFYQEAFAKRVPSARWVSPVTGY